jgi:diguanylate cyclase (GGDEF)-like protein
MSNNKSNKIEYTEEMLELFYTDSIQSLLVVSAQSQKIILANEALFELLDTTDDLLLGKKWYDLDSEENKEKYHDYIKQINSNEKIIFPIKIPHQNSEQILSCEYHLGFLDGEMVYVGLLKTQQVADFSNNLIEYINEINHLPINIQEIETYFTDLKKSFDLDFLVYFEIDNESIQDVVMVANNEVKNAITDSGLSTFFKISKSKKNSEINRISDMHGQHFKLLNLLKIETLLVYPIHHNQKVMGSIVMGYDTKLNNQVIKFILSAIVSRCQLCLYEKGIISQRNKEGQMDKLTNLPNRNSMTEKLSTIIETGIELDHYLSLMIIDFEKLNYYNKRYGIEITDEIIVNLSKVLVKVIGYRGQVYRLSGDEFLVLLKPHIEKEFVEEKAVEVLSLLSNSILLSNGEEVDINCNIGISIFPDDGQTVASMMKNADMALYDAKLKGKNNYIVFKFSETGQALKQKIEMEENLRLAIDSGHIKVFYQPKIDAVTEDIVGFEALVRWIDPVVGMINPGQFIPLAEETGLINDLGEYIATHTCNKLIEWQRKFGLTLTCSINLSVVQLMDDQLPKKLENIINASGIHPHYIDFEITETISLNVVPNLVDLLNQIVGIGCTLSIDDFGTGHSSLDYVKKIPAHYIKIDQSFVANIGLNPEDEAILDATINIAKRLNRKIIAEGVETEEQREYLLDRECEFFQGFLFSRPLPEEEIEELLSQRIKLMGTT